MKYKILLLLVILPLLPLWAGYRLSYVLDGPGSNAARDENFCPSRPALGPTQPPVKWVPGLSRGKVRPGRAADHSPTSSAAVMEE